MFAVQIVARDQQRLRSKAAALWDQARDCCTDASYFAVKQLSYMRDVEAVPFLEKGLEQQIANFFRALEQIGGPDARAALVRLSNSPVAWVPRMRKCPCPVSN